MKVLGLDLSTSTGTALFINDELKECTNIKCKVKGNQDSDDYPFNYIDMADKIAFKVLSLVDKHKPDYIIIEETNKGKNRYFQKQLEFIHKSVISVLRTIVNKHDIKLLYIDTSAWRSILQITLDKDQRKNNRDVNKTRKEMLESKIKEISQKRAHELMDSISGLTKKREINKLTKAFEKEVEVEAKKFMRGFRTKNSKIDTKNLSVNYVNEVFDLKFKKKDNDMADAICVAHAFIKNNYNSNIVR